MQKSAHLLSRYPRAVILELVMPFRDSSLRSRMTPKGHNQAKDLRGRALIKKGQRIFSVFSLTENTQRYKSLAGFAIFPSGAIFAFGKRDALWGARDLYHIVPSLARYIATCRAGACSCRRLYRIRIANISPNRKRGNISIMKPICFLYLSL